MDKKLHILQHLYGEREDHAELRQLLEDEDLQAEYQALSEVKFRLDHRKRLRPDSQAIDQIMLAAGDDSTSLGPRQDRAARPRQAANWYRMAGVVASVFSIMVVAAIVWIQIQEGQLDPTALETTAEKKELSSTHSDEVNSPVLRERAFASSADTRAEPRATVPIEVAEELESDTIPSWDDAERVLELHRRMQLLQARSNEFEWDESAVMSLDVLPGQSGGQAGLRVVGQQRPGSNNQ